MPLVGGGDDVHEAAASLLAFLQSQHALRAFDVVTLESIDAQVDVEAVVSLLTDHGHEEVSLWVRVETPHKKEWSGDVLEGRAWTRRLGRFSCTAQSLGLTSYVKDTILLEKLRSTKATRFSRSSPERRCPSRRCRGTRTRTPRGCATAPVRVVPVTRSTLMQAGRWRPLVTV